MLPRVLETEAMDSAGEARDYDAMDHRDVNDRFIADFLSAREGAASGPVLDVGTGTARIPIALCQQVPSAHVLGIDVAEAMLEVGRANVAEAKLGDRILLERHDARRIAAPDGSFAAVISNSIIHHIPDPAPVFAEMVRLVAPGGILFIRDLARPDNRELLDELVRRYAGQESPTARSLFADSLHAAFTLDEIRAFLIGLRLPADAAVMTSDRHWTISWNRSR